MGVSRSSRLLEGSEGVGVGVGVFSSKGGGCGSAESGCVCVEKGRIAAKVDEIEGKGALKSERGDCMFLGEGEKERERKTARAAI